MSQQDQEGVLSRWSRRKLQTQDETKKGDKPVETVVHESADKPVTVDALGDGVPETPILTDEDMPTIESLDENSDFSMFMSPGVSDKLRNLALRKMFHAPAFNICDGLDEYDEDYTYFEKLGDILTCDMKHQIEMQEKKKREEAEAKALADDETVEVENIDDSELPAENEAHSDDSLVGQLTDENTCHADPSDPSKVIYGNETNAHE